MNGVTVEAVNVISVIQQIAENDKQNVLNNLELAATINSPLLDSTKKVLNHALQCAEHRLEVIKASRDRIERYALNIAKCD